MLLSSSLDFPLLIPPHASTPYSQADAQRLLRAHNYRIEPAVESFFGDATAMANAAKASGTASSDRKAEAASRENLNKLFEQYKGK